MMQFLKYHNFLATIVIVLCFGQMHAIEQTRGYIITRRCGKTRFLEILIFLFPNYMILKRVNSSKVGLYVLLILLQFSNVVVLS